ncbi:MAG: Choice-of-anchor protein [Bacteroidota bacterium]|nr:Choice-of-anchor protein [Bacteroidota bacterium]
MNCFAKISSIILAFVSVILFNSIGLHSQNLTWLKDVSREAGLDSAFGAKILLVDVNNDNFPDLLWGTGNINKNRFKLYLNVPNPDISSSVKRIFTDFTDSSNINYNRDTNKKGRIIDLACMTDVNNDGNLDLITAIYYHRWEMYHGKDFVNGDSVDRDPGDRCEVLLGDGKGHFTLKSDNGLYQLDLPYFMTKGLTNASGLGLLDYDLDGNVDLYIATWFKDYANDVKMTDILTKGAGDGSFSFVPTSGIENVTEPMYGVNVTDWDNDGWPDVITSGYCRSGGSLFRNMHNGTFNDEAAAFGYTGQALQGDHGQNLCQWEAQPADFDCDGDMDLLQVEVHGGYNPGEGRTHVTINKGFNYGYSCFWDLDRIRRDAPLESHLGDQGGSWFDLDGDGRLDVTIGQMAYPDANQQGQERLYILRQNDSGYFDDISKDLGIFYTMKEAHSQEQGDFDLDGDQDLFFSRQVRDTTKLADTTIIKVYTKIFLLQNNIGNKNNWCSVKLTPPAGANGSAIGARITICSDGLNQIQEIQAGLGHFSNQQPFIRNVGIGKRNRIDSIIVRWPKLGNPATVVYNPPINTILHIDSSGLKNFVKPYAGLKPIIKFRQPYLSTGTINVGESNEYSFDVENAGDSTLTVTDYFIENDKSTAFQIIGKQVPFSVEPGKTKQITIKFSPMERDDFKPLVTFVSNAQNASRKSFDVYGKSFAPAPMLQISSRNIVFKPTFIGASDDVKITIINKGELKLNISDAQFIGNTGSVFSFAGLQTPKDIESGDSVGITLKFEPKTKIQYNAKLSLSTNAYRDTTVEISLSGLCDGPSPQISISLGTVFFSKVLVGSSADRDLNVYNFGNAPLTIDSVIIEDNDDLAYSILEPQFPFSIDSGDVEIVKIRLAPSEVKSYSRLIYFYSNSVTDSVKSVRLSGSGYVVSVDDLKIGAQSEISVYPNPVNENTIIEYTINSSAAVNVEFRIIDVLGRTAAIIVNNTQGEGRYTLPLNISGLSAGVYYITAKIGDDHYFIPIAKGK